MKKVAVIGSGAYGSYIIDTLIRKDPKIKITLFEVGTSQIKNELEIGYKTNLLSKVYTGLEKGRFFGFGGATTKWGGQLLIFSKNDIKEPSTFMKGIIDLNERYKKLVLSKFNISNDFEEKFITDRLFTKSGIWLSYFKRDLFKYFKISKRKNVRIIELARVIKICSNESRKVNKIIYKQGGTEKEMFFDHYFLAAGAFESNRILLNSNLTKKKKIPFSDHLSQKVFKIKGSTILGKENFSFKVRGSSLITKRLIGEIEGISFFVNPIFNSEFPFFQNLKKVLFKQEYSFRLFKDIFKDLPSFFGFVWSLIVKKQIYVYKGIWFLYIDVENSIGNSYMSLANDYDEFGERAVDVNFEIGDKIVKVYEEAKLIVKEYLIKNNVNFEECDSEILVEKCEDTYHPYGMMCHFESVEDYFLQYENLFIVNTGVLPRAGGINSTASIFPLIEEYINKYYK